MVALWGVAVSYERGTPVGDGRVAYRGIWRARARFHAKVDGFVPQTHTFNLRTAVEVRRLAHTKPQSPRTLQ